MYLTFFFSLNILLKSVTNSQPTVTAHFMVIDTNAATSWRWRHVACPSTSSAGPFACTENLTSQSNATVSVPTPCPPRVVLRPHVVVVAAHTFVPRRCVAASWGRVFAAQSTRYFLAPTPRFRRRGPGPRTSAPSDVSWERRRRRAWA